ncbi:hypothetical protein CURTO8I2_320077 [Curtobacterium sp. 8I-2]|nr:hypothetical protein CURTO8I2_320077 [Curtobacterium sp. 8I-2]
MLWACGPFFHREAFGGSVASSLVAASRAVSSRWRGRLLRDFRHAVASSLISRRNSLPLRPSGRHAPPGR